jgi:predicted transcriptional regulator
MQMEANAYILKESNAFTLETKISDVKKFFNETTYSHYPVIKNKQLIGLISETDIQGIEASDEKLSTYNNLLLHFYGFEDHNLLELVHIFATNEANLIPIVTSNQEYLGYYDLIDILTIYSDSPFLNDEGIILQLEKEVHHYAISEICQIVESNKGKVLGVYLADTNETTVEITLKFTSPDVNETIQTFRRYDYKILTKHKEDFYFEDLEERSNYLRKYLNI